MSATDAGADDAALDDGRPDDGSARVQVDALPGVVRQRAVRYASDALGRLPAEQVPPTLRRAASFAPARRAKIIGTQILDVLESDERFRERLATQVAVDAADVRGTVVAVEDGDPAPHGARRTDAAAVAYLLSSPATRPLVDVAVAVEHAAAHADSELEETVERLRQQLSRARGDVKQQRDKHRRELDQVKSDNQQLRRTLGRARADLKAATDAWEELGAARAEEHRSAEASQRQAEAELRRLRSRVAELEQDTSQHRRAAREDRDAETTRLRLLLDTVVGAATGLRRELALGPVEVLPADLVEGVRSGDGGQTRPSARQGDPRTLRRWLEMPRAHVVVDGYNVSKTAWPRAPLDQQRQRLVTALSGLVAGTSTETTVVFDGADLPGVPAVPSGRGVRARFSPPGVIADDTIRSMVEAEPAGRVLVVVSSDRELAESVVALGARSATSEALVSLLPV